MTLLWEVLIGASVLSIISALEDTSITCTFLWVINGATNWPTGCTPQATKAQANLNTNTPTAITTT